MRYSVDTTDKDDHIHYIRLQIIHNELFIANALVMALS